ncbi:siderophore-interacting protein [Spirilliplanes yamanashiensis]|uniref:Siderophore-interacting protein n=1 Tax=Spirilliplanes yamanashiensis TaxID=42233 RepID=A0A8J3Y8I9_9ACTN|nr:siderophore-interacting protein [Spirilliplanes yamanashiensis]MDP9815619.1 NADPH-dependent ferric siderophore reductase [Spirilliplanes yamanashiensis]GIJ03873.1 siderophore-interacting protein [Spirilliplanes yamanashiensis]
MTDTVLAPWRFFVVEVVAARRLGPSFLRVTFTGDELHDFADNGFDQRIKLAFPESPVAEAHLPSGTDWYRRWRELPEDHRSPIRTYTVRAVRPQERELDVDIVLHDGVDQGGPACRWARRARPGDRVAVLGPVAGYDGDHGGIGFRPPADGGPLLLAGDETAAPAIGAILERLPSDARGLALLEVPYPEDVLEIGAPSGVVVRWLPRHGRAPGCELVPAVQRAAAGPDAPAYTWLAGEAGVVTALRRHLVAERGFDRAAVTFMGYWRRGRADAQAA